MWHKDTIEWIDIELTSYCNIDCPGCLRQQMHKEIDHILNKSYITLDNLKKWFHTELKKSCDRHNKNYYKKYKKWCDNYFYLAHRNEPRGIGGIFFDYKKDNWEKDFAFVRDVGITFKKISKNIILNKKKKRWTKKQKNIQYFKRGRYVEFNLLYDRGTRFGLQTGGNVEGILMSLPPLAKWK